MVRGVLVEGDVWKGSIMVRGVLVEGDVWKRSIMGGVCWWREVCVKVRANVAL